MEQSAPRFVAYLGSVHLAAIEAVVVCGYTSRRGTSGPVLQQSCYLYYRHWADWHPLTLYENTVFFEGAFVPWYNRLGQFWCHLTC